MIEDFLAEDEEPGGLLVGIAVALAVEAGTLLVVLGYLKLAGFLEGVR